MNQTSSSDNENSEEVAEVGVGATESTPPMGEDEIELQAVMNPAFRWYIVNTYSGSEETAKGALLERIQRSNLEESFGRIVVPKTVVEKVMKSGKKKRVDKTSFPGYILVQMKMDEDTMACVTSTPKVTGFVGNRKAPRAMSDKEVLRLLSPGKAVVDQPEATITFEKSEAVKVIDGPFTNFDGVVEEVRPEKMKLKVLVSIFGRETPVELNYAQVEKLS